MAVDAAQPWRIEHGLRQDQAIGHDHHQVRLQRGQLRLSRRITQCLRLQHRNVVLHGELFDRAGHQLLAAPGRAVRLGIDRNDRFARIEQGLQVLGGEFRSAGENDAQGLGHGDSLRKGLP